jgi:hypothetical protein
VDGPDQKNLSCPGCGTDVSLSLDITCVTVCPSCLKVLERGDVGLVDRGVLAPLRETRSRLRVGLRGRYDKKFFTVCGRVQITESQGNLWDEWYAAFDGGAWGWLAETGGRIWLSMAVEHPGYVPKFDQIRAGDVLSFDAKKFTVTEVDVGQVVAGEGEIPFFFTPDERIPFADLSGENAGFGTIDYTFDPPRVYLGRELPVESFRLDRDIDTRIEGDRPDKRDAPAPAPPPDTLCPGCQKKIDLRVPGATMRVVCPHCNLLSDLNGRAATTRPQGRDPRRPRAADVGPAGRDRHAPGRETHGRRLARPRGAQRGHSVSLAGDPAARREGLPLSRLRRGPLHARPQHRGRGRRLFPGRRAVPWPELRAVLRRRRRDRVPGRRVALEGRPPGPQRRGRVRGPPADARPGDE